MSSARSSEGLTEILKLKIYHFWVKIKVIMNPSQISAILEFNQMEAAPLVLSFQDVVSDFDSPDDIGKKKKKSITKNKENLKLQLDS